MVNKENILSVTLLMCESYKPVIKACLITGKVPAFEMSILFNVFDILIMHIKKNVQICAK